MVACGGTVPPGAQKRGAGGAGVLSAVHGKLLKRGRRGNPARGPGNRGGSLVSPRCPTLPVKGPKLQAGGRGRRVAAHMHGGVAAVPGRSAIKGEVGGGTVMLGMGTPCARRRHATSGQRVHAQDPRHDAQQHQNQRGPAQCQSRVRMPHCPLQCMSSSMAGRDEGCVGGRAAVAVGSFRPRQAAALATGPEYPVGVSAASAETAADVV